MSGQISSGYGVGQVAPLIPKIINDALDNKSNLNGGNTFTGIQRIEGEDDVTSGILETTDGSGSKRGIRITSPKSGVSGKVGIFNTVNNLEIGTRDYGDAITVNGLDGSIAHNGNLQGKHFMFGDGLSFSYGGHDLLQFGTSFHQNKTLKNGYPIEMRYNASGGVLSFAVDDTLRTAGDPHSSLYSKKIFEVQKDKILSNKQLLIQESVTGDKAQFTIDNTHGASLSLGITGTGANQNSFIKTQGGEDLYFNMGRGCNSSNPVMKVKANGGVSMANLPTSPSGLSSGDLWKNGTTVSII